MICPDDPPRHWSGQQNAGPPPKRRPGAQVELDQLTVMVNASLVDALVYSSPEYVATTE
jgi:hypothetical protein